jgi:hypothetical protein
MTLRQEVSKILGFTIPTGAWRSSFDLLQKEARILPKHLIQIILLLCEREEQREKEE